MSKVVTIYCCGTNFSRDQKSDEAVAYCWDKTTSRKLILDGPGSPRSVNPNARILKTENIMKAVESRKKTWLGKDAGPGKVPEKLFSDERHYRVEKNLEGALHGVGWADNVIMAIQWLWEQFYVGKSPSATSNLESFSTVNLVGWSRGAVTCIMLAHAIEEAGFKRLKPEMKVNVFAFDPVPGGWNDFKVKGTFDATGRVGSPNQLPEIVDHYQAVLMENESSGLFKCVSPAEFSSGYHNFVEYPLPGVHADCVRFLKADNPAGKIGIHLCQRFLIDCGTEGTFDKVLSDNEVLENYARMRLQVGTAKGSIAKPRLNFIKNMRRADVFFMNGHHHDTFNRAQPRLVSDIVSQKQLSDLTLGYLKVQLPKTLDALHRSGLV